MLGFTNTVKIVWLNKESSWVVVDRLKKIKSILEKFKINFKLIDSTSITKTPAIIKMQKWIFNSGMKYSFEICKEHRHKTILSPLQGKEMEGMEMIDPFSIFKNKEKPNASKRSFLDQIIYKGNTVKRRSLLQI